MWGSIKFRLLSHCYAEAKEYFERYAVDLLARIIVVLTC
jgi:hypothetical protein